MEPLKLAKSFKYVNTDEGKGAIFHGAVLADQSALYLIHNKHTWESAGTATAAFGLIGALIHHFATRNKPIAYPYPCLPVSELTPVLKTNLDASSFKETAQVSIIPKDQIQGYSKSMFSGTKFFVGDVEIVLMGVYGKAFKQLPELGYVQPDA